MKRIGIERGKSFDIDKVDPAIKAALEAAPKDAARLMAWKVASIARVANGWSMNTDTMGVYGNYYLKRAIVTQLGLGANLPEDAIYPLNIADETGKTLDGANAYVLHFDKGATPPVSAFWSVTLYDSDGFQVANSLNRFAVSSWMPFKYDPDGSLDLYLPECQPRRRQGGELAARTEGALQSHDAALRAAERRPDGEMESAAGDAGSPAHAIAAIGFGRERRAPDGGTVRVRRPSTPGD